MSRRMLVSMSEENVEALLALKQTPDEMLDAVVGRIAKGARNAPAKSLLGLGVPASRQDSWARCYSIRLVGEPWVESSAKDVMISVLRKLDARDASLLQRLSQGRGRSRCLIARQREKLYAPDRTDLAAKYAVKLREGWWVSTNHACRDIRRWLVQACVLTGLKYGHDLVITPDLT